MQCTVAVSLVIDRPYCNVLYSYSVKKIASCSRCISCSSCSECSWRVSQVRQFSSTATSTFSTSSCSCSSSIGIYNSISNCTGSISSNSSRGLGQCRCRPCTTQYCKLLRRRRNYWMELLETTGLERVAVRAEIGLQCVLTTKPYDNNIVLYYWCARESITNKLIDDVPTVYKIKQLYCFVHNQDKVEVLQRVDWGSLSFLYGTWYIAYAARYIADQLDSYFGVKRAAPES